ncbi:hypothetical protein [Ferrovibrio sp.]|uniref:hypothetical protein n=1 Tax=Ferrovibrio sp. TaxID=1917215 RepID=UPI003D0DB2F4
MLGNGFLAIWSDVAPEQETDYLHWLTREHTPERMGVQGFVAVRVFRALLAGVNRFLIVYELETPEALSGPSYLGRLNDPTPWSQRIMPILQNFARGGGQRRLSCGIGQGGFIAALPFDVVPQHDGLLEALAATDRIAAVHLLVTDQARTEIQTNEKKLRDQDRSFAALLLIEGLDQAALQSALAKHAARLQHAGTAMRDPLYSFMFALNGRRWP